MGYPMRSGYRGVTPGAEIGLSKLEVPDSVAQFMKRVDKLPANDIAKRRLKLWLRANPWLRIVQTGWDLYDILGGVNQTRPGGASVICGGGGDFGPIAGLSTCGSPLFQGGFRFGVDARKVGNNWVAQFLYGTKNLAPPKVADVAAVYSAQVPINPPNYRWAAAGIPFPPYRRPQALPWELPWFDPWALPIANPAPLTNPVPWPAIPGRPRPFPDPDPSPVPHPTPVPVPYPGVEPGPVPIEEPGPDPEPQPEPSPNPKPVVPPWVSNPLGWDMPVRAGRVKESGIVVRQSSSPIHRPPGRHTTEMKIRTWRSAAGLTWLLAHGVTETKDLVEALWSALPKRFKHPDKKGRQVNAKSPFKSHHPRVQTMVSDLNKGLRNMDWMGDEGRKYVSNAIANVAANQLQDYVFGRTGRAVANESARSGRAIGCAAGPAL